MDETKEEKAMRLFLEAVADGASIVMHPDTLSEFVALLPKGKPLSFLPRGNELIPSEYLPRGRMIAIPKQEAFFPEPTFTFGDL